MDDGKNSDNAVPDKSGTQGGGQPETLSEMLFPLSDAAARRELEEYRIRYEAVHGPTDLTKRYTSVWPAAQRDWLCKNDIKQYFDGLPPFVKAFLKGKMQLVAKEGRLDDMPDEMLRLYASGGMTLDHGTRRGR